ncbi:MAG: PD40 domain-containing protein [Planctomycetes bacterium]|nr:PD40 domain-containing protein [Planctomycetota bacterium]
MSPATKAIAWTFAGLSALGITAAVAWQLQSARTSIYTDGDRIAAPAPQAPLRSILWQPAVEVPNGLNTTADEYEPRISADGARMVFVRGKPGANADLYECRWTPDGWSTPAPITGLNTTNDELGPELSRDGTQLYFYSDRPGGQGGYDIWVARADGTGWREPENLGPAINSEHNEYGPALTPDGATLYFSSNRPRAGEPPRQRDAWPATVRESRDRHDYDLYKVALTPNHSDRPAPVAALNTPFDEGSPCISPAGDFLYFASDRPGGMGGFDIYRARLSRGEVGPPEPLGSAVNSTANDLDPALSMDGFRLCFSSSRASGILPPRDGAADAVDYGLWTTSSREVYLHSDAQATLAALLLLLRGIAPWLLLLLPLGVLFFTLRDPRFRRGFGKLSLLAQCVLISLMIHALVASLLAVWKVGSRIGDYLAEGGGNRVILASSGVADGAILQVRGELTDPFTSSTDLPESRADLISSPLRMQPVSLAAPNGEVRDQAAPLSGPAPAPAPTSSPSFASTALSPLDPDARTPDTIAASPAVDESSLKTPAPSTSNAPMPALTATPISATRVAISPSSSKSAPSDQAPPLEPTPQASSAPLAAVNAAPQLPALDAGPTATRTPTAAAPSATVTETAVSTPAPTGSDTPARLSTPTPTVTAARATIAPITSAAPESDRAAAVPLAAPSITPGPSVAALPVAPAPTAGVGTAPAVSVPQNAATAPRVGAESSVPESLSRITDGPRAALSIGSPASPPSITTRVETAPVPAAASDSASLPIAAALSTREPSAAGPATGPASRPAPVPTHFASGDSSRLPPTEPDPKPLDTFAQRAPESRGELLKKMGGSEDTERAVGLALDWLKAHQSADGHWSGRRFDDGHEPAGGAAEIDSDAAMTGLSLLCFLGAGHTHTADGPYRADVQHALDWLIARQSANGDLRRDPARPDAPGETMYSHNIATVALCEAFAMTRDPKLAGAARRAVAFMISIQANPDPARRGTRARAEDTSVIGWQVMAMHSARRSGFTVPQSAFDAASAWLNTVASPSQPGRYAYTRGEAPSAAMTAEAMFIQQLLGHIRAEPRMEQSARFVLETPPRWADGAPTHYWYYATLALFQHQGDEWRAWNDQLVPELLRHQHQTGPAAGTWDPKDEWSRLGGRIYQTAICTLSLEVYYRYKAPQP